MYLLTELLGYLAIAAGFYAITRKDMGGFRLWHLISNFVYIFYGMLIASGPLIISGAVFAVIHAYHLRKMRMFSFRIRKPGGI